MKPTTNRGNWRPYRLAAPFGLALALAACGGGGGGGGGSGTLVSPDAVAPKSTISGIAVDGYLQGATVFIDLNRNGMYDAGEPGSVTDANGRYTIDTSGLTGGLEGLSLVVIGGIDTDTGFAFAGKLTADAGSASQGQVISPLTTLVDAIVSQEIAPDIASATALVANALGLTIADLSTDPIAAIATRPALYTTTVALQRAVQLLAAGNTQDGESDHDAQERVIRALAVAIGSQTSAIDLSALIAQLPLDGREVTIELVESILSSVGMALESEGHDGARTALRAMDEIRVKIESGETEDIQSAARSLDDEHGEGESHAYEDLVRDGSSSDTLDDLDSASGGSSTPITQPASTAGRLLASNCFQCHGTGGNGGFEGIRGSEAAEIREYLNKPASESIMAAHAQGYTSAQIEAIIAYLKQ